MGRPGNLRRNLKVHGNKLKWKHNGLKPLVFSKSGSKREGYSNTHLPQEARKISNKQSNFILKGARKRTTNKT